ncbi:hypothetical protein H5410_052497 [Solanum commersonii]|uniref:Uncharacterized protein n=1 Tax=Solanum commersonii TaxID=4109 RepID=A0A9J5X3S7_SOLCO|nr:hypothetical protein H5410_052497 [Solanum commersonii]
MDNEIQKLKTNEDNLKSKASQQHDYKNAELRRSKDGKNPELKGDDGKLLKTHNVCLNTAAAPPEFALFTGSELLSGNKRGERRQATGHRWSWPSPELAGRLRCFIFVDWRDEREVAIFVQLLDGVASSCWAAGCSCYVLPTRRREEREGEGESFRGEEEVTNVLGIGFFDDKIRKNG